MEKPKASTRKLKTSLCMPRFRGNAGNIGYKNKGLSPMTLLERFREAVFRLIMLSALSKAATNNHAGGSADVIQPCCYYPNDPHHSEAVADCIEFIKKKASADDENDHQNRVSSASSSSIHAAPEAVIPVPGLSCNSPT